MCFPSLKTTQTIQLFYIQTNLLLKKKKYFTNSLPSRSFARVHCIILVSFIILFFFVGLQRVYSRSRTLFGFSVTLFTVVMSFLTPCVVLNPSVARSRPPNIIPRSFAFSKALCFPRELLSFPLKIISAFF